jgi:hypothetical protein
MVPHDFPGEAAAAKVYHWKRWLVMIRKELPRMDSAARSELRETLEDYQTRTRLPDEAIAVLAALRDLEMSS